MKNAIIDNVPLKKYSQKTKENPPWFNKELENKIKTKFKLFVKKRASPKNEELRIDYNKICKIIKKEVKKTIIAYEQSIVARSKHDPKILYAYINQNKKCKEKIKNLLDINNILTNNKKEICNILNEQFYEAFSNSSEDVPHLEKRTEKLCTYDKNTIFSPKIIEKILTKLDKNKSTGIDEIHPLVLKECATNLSIPLSLLFKKSFESGLVPTYWKMANVTPIFKKGSKVIASNYRPISLTSITCRVMERIIRDIMMKHLIDNNLISNQQHGFVNNKSCTTNLLETLDFLTETLNRGLLALLIFLDFAKAFDKVSHKALLVKLKAYGFTDEIITWIKDYLTNRKQRVVIEGESSEWLDVLSGVPQGSVLGPLLFVIFINDMPNTIASLSKLFADDSKILAQIKTQTTW